MSPKLNVPRNALDRRQQAAVIGQRIRDLRLERGWTQARVAGDRFTKAYISALETGAAVPSLPSLEFISSQLGVPPEWFLLTRNEGETVALPARVSSVRFGDGRVYADLDDGRSFGLPISRSRKLMAARVEQLDQCVLVDYGRAISWPAIGEEIGLEDFLGIRVLMPAEVAASVPLSQAPEPSVATRPVRARSARAPTRAAKPPARAAKPRARSQRASQYEPIIPHLSAQPGSELTLTFEEVERILGRTLPSSARRYLAPWSSSTNPLGRAIRIAGWRARADLDTGVVTLMRGGQMRRARRATRRPRTKRRPAAPTG